MYDIFFISASDINDDAWQLFKKRYPRSQKIENVSSFDQIRSKAFTKFFWVVWDDLVVNESFDFSYKVLEWDKEYIHVFKNGDYYDGICLHPKTATFSQKEFFNRFFVNGKKEMDQVASMPKPFDAFFISYNEVNAEENYKNLLKKVPYAKRVHGVKGIHQAHIEAAKNSSTEMFWVVDGDAQVLNDFKFSMPQIPYYNLQERNNFNETVHVWKSQNPINGLVYGYGGVKLLPKKLTLAIDVMKPDMTTSISNKFKVMSTVSNITQFNTDPFTTWRSAFRECVKLASNVIDRYYDEETDHRLKIWCTEGIENKFGEYAIDGAIEGKKYGENNIGNLDALSKINDFEWLKEKFKNGR